MLYIIDFVCSQRSQIHSVSDCGPSTLSQHRFLSAGTWVGDKLHKKVNTEFVLLILMVSVILNLKSDLALQSLIFAAAFTLVRNADRSRVYYFGFSFVFKSRKFSEFVLIRFGTPVH